jgi:tripartite-type tricarboxylate transporter receptor subunit TctC
MNRRRAAAVLAALGILPLRSRAEIAGGKPIRLLVPFAPGGAPDVVARVLAQQLGLQLKQSVVVENKPGGNSIVAADAVAKAVPDGLTLLFNTGSHTINPFVYTKMPFDTQRDFAPVSLLKTTPGLVLVVNPALPAKTLREFIEQAKTGKLSFGSPGVGNPQQFPGELLNLTAGTKLLHVPYRGGNLALNAVIGGEIACSFVSVISALEPIKAGQVRALGVTSAVRLSALPQVPTIAESGVPGYEMSGGWQGIFAPARTPPAVVAQLAREIHEAVQAPDVKARILSDDSIPVGSTPEAFAKFLAEDSEKVAKIIKSVGIRIE